MHKTSLLEILRTFQHNEIKKFDDFVNSPYHNKKSAVTNLYKHIKKYAPEFKSPRLKKEKVWNSLYPEKEFNYGVFKNLIYDLTHLSEKFITVEYCQRDNFWDNFELCYNFLDCLNEREIKNLFKSKFQTIKKHFDDLQNRNEIPAEVYFSNMSRIYLLKFGFSNQFDRSSPMDEELNKYTLFKTAILLYFIFHTGINAINFSRDYNYKKEENLLLTFLQNADSYNLIYNLIESLKPLSKETYHILNTYYKYYLSVSENISVEKYFDFKKTLNSNVQYLSKPDLHILYSGLRIAVVNLKSPYINKSREYIDIVKIKIRNSVMLSPDEFLTESEFTSCIQSACDLGDSEFIKDFTDRFIKYLPKVNRKNMEKFSMSHLHFAKNDFEKSLGMIFIISYDLFIMKIYLKNLQMMNYYELNDHNSFLLFLDSYKHFLNNNKSITEEWKKEQTTFNTFLNKLFKLKEKFSGFELKNLKDEISSSLVPMKQWLLRKIDELESKAAKIKLLELLVLCSYVC